MRRLHLATAVATLLVAASFAHGQSMPGRDANLSARVYNPGFFYCGSQHGRTATCAVNISGGVRLTRQLSNTPCVEGVTWGLGSYGIWVTDGCRAQFAAGYGFGSGAHHGRFRKEVYVPPPPPPKPL